MKKFLLLLICTTFLSKQNFSREIESNIIVLVDFSTSYFSKDRNTLIKRNIEKLSGIIADEYDGPERPALIQFVGIHDNSQGSEQVCPSFTIKRSKLIGMDKEEKYASTDPEIFLEHMNIKCKKVIMSRPGRPETDIQGALSLAHQLATSQTDNDKYLIILSDMAESRNQDTPVTNYNLEGFKILVVCSKQLLYEDNNKKYFCMDLKSEWTSKFKKLGAKKVIFTLETGDWELESGINLFR
jgi:hypothetical protein